MPVPVIICPLGNFEASEGQIFSGLFFFFFFAISLNAIQLRGSFFPLKSTSGQNIIRFITSWELHGSGTIPKFDNEETRFNWDE